MADRSISEIRDIIQKQLPYISPTQLVYRGLAYHLDPLLTGSSKNFATIESEARMLQLDQSYVLDKSAAQGRNGLVFRHKTPVIGEILEFKNSQYQVSNIVSGIVYISPALSLDAPELATFRSVGRELTNVQTSGERELIVETAEELHQYDYLQLNILQVQIKDVIPLEAENQYKVTTYESLRSLDKTIRTKFLLNVARYESNLIHISSIGCPFDLVFPFASQFTKDYSVTLEVDLCTPAGKVLNKIVHRNTESPSHIRIPFWYLGVSANCLTMMERIEGKMDFNGSAVGLYSGCVINWEDDFPEDGIDSWRMSYKSEVAGTLTVRFDPLGVVQKLPIKRGQNTVKFDSFGAIPGKCTSIKFGFKAEEGSSDSLCLWITELTPNLIYNYLKYRIIVESDELFKREHFICYGPKAQPSLMNIQYCFGNNTLDSGYLLPRRNVRVQQ